MPAFKPVRGTSNMRRRAFDMNVEMTFDAILWLAEQPLYVDNKKKNAVNPEFLLRLGWLFHAANIPDSAINPASVGCGK